MWSALLLPALAAVLCSSCSAQRLPLQDQQPPMGMDHQLFVDAFGEAAPHHREPLAVRHPVDAVLVNQPGASTPSSSPHLYVSSFMTNQVLRFPMDPTTGTAGRAHVFAGGVHYSPDLGHAILDGPWGLAPWAGTMLVASFTSDQVLAFSLEDGALVGLIGSEEVLDCPEGLARLGDTLFVASYGSDAVVVFQLSKGPSGLVHGRHLASLTCGPLLRGVEHVALLPDGSLLATSHHTHDLVRIEFNATAAATALVAGRGKPSPHAQCSSWLAAGASPDAAAPGVSSPIGVAVGVDGAVYVGSYRACQVLRFDLAGTKQGVAVNGGPLRGPAGVRVGLGGELLVTSYDNHKVFLFNSTASPMELRIDVGLATQQHPRRRRLLG